MEAHDLPSPVLVARMTLTLTVHVDNCNDFETSTLTAYGNNIKRIETVTKQIIEIEELREEKLQRVTKDKFTTVIKVTPSALR